IREYAVEGLELSEDASTVHCRHAQHFLGLAEEAEPNLIGTGATQTGSTGWSATTTISGPPWTGSRRQATAAVRCGWRRSFGASGMERGIWWRAAAGWRARSAPPSNRPRPAQKLSAVQRTWR